MDPYTAQRTRQPRRSKEAAKGARTNGVKRAASRAGAGEGAAEDKTTLVSDYTGVFDEYPMETFLHEGEAGDGEGDGMLHLSLND